LSNEDVVLCVSPKVVPTKKPKRGRPRKTDIEAKKKRGVVGRPPGDTARLQELKARLLATSGEKMIRKVVDIAMTDGHPGQMAAMKLCLDRVLPLSMFEKDASGSRSAVTINITGLTQAPPVEIVDNAIDVEVKDVDG
jgi:hypothetical protein